MCMSSSGRNAFVKVRKIHLMEESNLQKGTQLVRGAGVLRAYKKPPIYIGNRNFKSCGLQANRM